MSQGYLKFGAPVFSLALHPGAPDAGKPLDTFVAAGGGGAAATGIFNKLVVALLNRSIMTERGVGVEALHEESTGKKLVTGAAFSPDGSCLAAVCGADCHLYRTYQGSEPSLVEVGVFSLFAGDASSSSSESGDGAGAAAGAQGEADGPTGTTLAWVLPPVASDNKEATAATALLATGTSDGRVLLWGLDTVKDAAASPPPWGLGRPPTLLGAYKPHTESIEALAYAEGFLASCSMDGTTVVADLAGMLHGRCASPLLHVLPSVGRGWVGDKDAPKLARGRNMGKRAAGAWWPRALAFCPDAAGALRLLVLESSQMGGAALSSWVPDAATAGSEALVATATYAAEVAAERKARGKGGPPAPAAPCTCRYMAASGKAGSRLAGIPVADAPEIAAATTGVAPGRAPWVLRHWSHVSKSPVTSLGTGHVTGLASTWVFLGLGDGGVAGVDPKTLKLAWRVSGIHGLPSSALLFCPASQLLASAAPDGNVIFLDPLAQARGAGRGGRGRCSSVACVAFGWLVLLALMAAAAAFVALGGACFDGTHPLWAKVPVALELRTRLAARQAGLPLEAALEAVAGLCGKGKVSALMGSGVPQALPAGETPAATAAAATPFLGAEVAAVPTLAPEAVTELPAAAEVVAEQQKDSIVVEVTPEPTFVPQMVVIEPPVVPSGESGEGLVTAQMDAAGEVVVMQAGGEVQAQMEKPVEAPTEAASVSEGAASPVEAAAEAVHAPSTPVVAEEAPLAAEAPASEGSLQEPEAVVPTADSEVHAATAAAGEDAAAFTGEAATEDTAPAPVVVEAPLPVE